MVIKGKIKMQLRLRKSQKGFAILHILPAFVLVAAIAFIGGNVYQTQVKKRDAARQAAQTEELKKQSELTIKTDPVQEETEVKVPAPAIEQKPVVAATAPKPTTTETKPKPTYTVVNFSSHTISVEGDNVTITGILPSAYNGKCAAKLKLMPNYDKYEYKEATLSGSTCTITFSKATLQAQGTTWKAFLSWNNNEYTVKGGYDGFEFSL